LISLGFLLLSGCATSGFSSSELSAKLSDPADLVQVRSVFKAEVELAPLVRNVVFHNEPGEFRYIEYTDPSSNSAKVVQLTSVLPDSIIVSYSPGGLNGAWKVSYTDYVQMHQYFWMLTRSQTDAENLARALNILVLDAATRPGWDIGRKLRKIQTDLPVLAFFARQAPDAPGSSTA